MDINYPHAPDWLDRSTILLVRHGSQAYGTSLPTSDLDLKGVAIPPLEYYLGFTSTFAQFEAREPEDVVIYELRKFFRLAAASNPNIIEVLWVDDADVIRETEAGARLRAARRRFLSKKARFTFAGYANSQLKRIKTHRRWLLNPPESRPTRTEFGLPERPRLSPSEIGTARSAIEKVLDSWSLRVDDLDAAQRVAVDRELRRILTEVGIGQDGIWESAARHAGFSGGLLEELREERRFKTKVDEWRQFQSWKRNRNPSRAALEREFGYDVKHGMHLVRLLRMAHEIATEGRVLVRRPDATELLAIRAGGWSYEELIAWAEDHERVLDSAFARTALPAQPDAVELDTLCVELCELHHRSA